MILILIIMIITHRIAMHFDLLLLLCIIMFMLIVIIFMIMTIIVAIANVISTTTIIIRALGLELQQVCPCAATKDSPQAGSFGEGAGDGNPYGCWA